MKRSCPICGSSGLRQILHRQRFVDGPLGEGYDVVVCGSCGGGFADGIPPQQELDRYYADRSKYEYAQSGGLESPYDFQRFEAIAEQIAPFLPSRDAAILDVGCATGGLLACFASRGFARLLGIDPSPASAAAAKRLHGLEVIPATIDELPGLDRQFDLILLVGVLEHIREVPAAIAAITARLAPGGLLYCAQPDVEAFADCTNAPFQQFSVEHVNFFSARSLTCLMANRGLGRIGVWRWMLEWREGVTDCVVSGLFSAGAEALAPAVGDETREALEAYLSQSRRAEAEIAAQIDRWVQSGEPMLVWGAGTLTRRLLASTRLGEMNIVAFIDSDPHLQGERLAGRPVLGPGQLCGRAEPILICSRAFAGEIKATIRSQLGLANSVVSI